ncbi:MAG TPA: RsmE family RNA methyltransferase [Candidatus Binatia bacterium]|nr:RsmE family RNA methyltransferase [Candidatus Binatia bacterium]
MTRRRWIADEVSGDRAALTGVHADHLTRVLRAHVGQEFDIVANGVLHRGQIATISDARVEFDLGEEIPAEAAPAQITLVLAIFKFDRMEWAIEKCTELGVERMIPVIARRTDSHLASASVKRVERWRRIALQASEQSRRAAPPEISEPIKLRDTLALPAKLKLVLSEAEDRSQLRDIPAHTAGEVLLAIGPEGGWTKDELEQFRINGWTSVSLGPTILRAETAAIAATAIATSALVR